LKERSVPNEFNLQTYIYEKSVTLADTGNYECKLDDTGVATAIHVYVFRSKYRKNLDNSSMDNGSNSSSCAYKTF